MYDQCSQVNISHNSYEHYLILLNFVGTRIGQASECFVYWKDPMTNDTWGLNFTSPIDAKQFRECCVSIDLKNNTKNKRIKNYLNNICYLAQYFLFCEQNLCTNNSVELNKTKHKWLKIMIACFLKIK